MAWHVYFQRNENLHLHRKLWTCMLRELFVIILNLKIFSGFNKPEPFQHWKLFFKVIGTCTILDGFWWVISHWVGEVAETEELAESQELHEAGWRAHRFLIKAHLTVRCSAEGSPWRLAPASYLDITRSKQRSLLPEVVLWPLHMPHMGPHFQSLVHTHAHTHIHKNLSLKKI